MARAIFGICILFIAGCAGSPAQLTSDRVTSEQLEAATDEQVCRAFRYKPTERLKREAFVRNLECDPLAAKCLSIGNAKGTDQFNQCYLTLTIIEENRKASDRTASDAANRDLMRTGFEMMQMGQPRR